MKLMKMFMLSVVAIVSSQANAMESGSGHAEGFEPITGQGSHAEGLLPGYKTVQFANHSQSNVILKIIGSKNITLKANEYSAPLVMNVDDMISFNTTNGSYEMEVRLAGDKTTWTALDLTRTKVGNRTMIEKLFTVNVIAEVVVNIEKNGDVTLDNSKK
jgi:hypothetical protein